MSGIKIVVAGAGGRMGQTLLHAIAGASDFELIGALEHKGHPDLGREVARWRDADRRSAARDCQGAGAGGFHHARNVGGAGGAIGAGAHCSCHRHDGIFRR